MAAAQPLFESHPAPAHAHDGDAPPITMPEFAAEVVATSGRRVRYVDLAAPTLAQARTLAERLAALDGLGRLHKVTVRRVATPPVGRRFL